MTHFLLWTLLLTNAAAIQSREAYVTRDGLRMLPFHVQLATDDKSHVLLPDAGHLVMLERAHRRFPHEVLSFLDRP